MATRADLFTETKKQREYFSDFLDSFFATPNGGDLAKTTNENSVRQSIKNLILTNIGERPFQPYVGTNVNRSLFEPNDVITCLEIKNYVQNAIDLYEPRAVEVSVDVQPVIDQHYIKISVIFYLINNPSPIDLTLQLKRVR